MRKVIAATLLASFIGLTGLSQTSFACGPGGMQGPGGFFAGGMKVRAQLDDATKVTFDQFVEDTQAIRREIVVKRAEVRALMNAEEPDASKIGVLSGELFDLRVSMHTKAKAAGLGEVMRAAHGNAEKGGPGYHHGRKGMMKVKQ